MTHWLRHLIVSWFYLIDVRIDERRHLIASVQPRWSWLPHLLPTDREITLDNGLILTPYRLTERTLAEYWR